MAYALNVDLKNIKRIKYLGLVMTSKRDSEFERRIACYSGWFFQQQMMLQN